ncbi:AGAP007774-PA, partial [Anopheles gambiae str. PEST]
GNKPKLRRFNSHDTSANMFSVAEFENARMARRNELENAALLRQRARYKLNSLSSGGGGGGGGGGDCSTGESKGSKLSSSESTTEPLFAEQFLERFSLPRVIRLSYTSSSSSSSVSPAAGSGHQGDQTMTSSSSAESSSTAERPTSGSKGKGKKGKAGQGGPLGGVLFLLYRYMRGYRSYHVFNTKAGTSRKKGYKIPHDFPGKSLRSFKNIFREFWSSYFTVSLCVVLLSHPGYFSFINDKGAPTATVYTTIVQLVRDQVYKFLSLDSLSAYTESHSDNCKQSRPKMCALTFHKTHYVKATAKAGQVYRLLAVFQDGDHKSATSPSSHKDGSGAGNGNVGGREKERGKYAQLLDDNRQIFYVSLSAKGKFYEIEQHSAPQHAQSSPHRKPKQLSRDCVHRIGFIMQSDPCLPLNLKLISPQTGTHSSTYVTIAKISEENFLIACPLDEQQLTTTLTLAKLHLTPQMKFAKCTMGFENEQHMFLNANVQTVLKFCQFNCDNFLRIVDHETNAIELQQMTALSSGGSDVLRRFGRLFGGGGSGGGSDRNGSGHEKEDSIIFLSKNDLESLECGAGGMDDRREHHHLHHQHHSLHQTTNSTAAHQHHSLVVDDRTLGGRANESVSADDEWDKRTSLDRYRDMSKLIQERFGTLGMLSLSSRAASTDRISSAFDDGTIVSHDPSSSVASVGAREKCLSLQHIEQKCKPDLVPPHHAELTASELGDTIFFPLRHSTNQQSFMTQKLYNEFHVKTKQYSKSSSSIQQLLHLASNGHRSQSSNQGDHHLMMFVCDEEAQEAAGKEKRRTTTTPKAVTLREPTSGTVAERTLLDDLPYSSVRDSIVLQAGDSDQDSSSVPAESIYAEICTEH